MMGDDDRDVGDIAELLGMQLALNADTPGTAIDGWIVEGLDIGEINVTTPTGQRFRFVGCELTGDQE